MQLSSTLAWLVDAAGEAPGADRLLAEIGAHLVADGLPLAGGALTLAVPHPLIARRTWLWRTESGEVIEALGVVPAGLAATEAASAPRDARRRRLTGLAPGCSVRVWAASQSCPKAIGPRRSPRRSLPGSIAAPARSTPSAARS